MGYDFGRSVRLSISSTRRELTVYANSIASCAALLLDIHTQRKTTRRGIYAMPEDDQAAQRLNELKNARTRSETYDLPPEQDEATTSVFDSDIGDIGYHNRYGDPDDGIQTIPSGPLGNHQAESDMGYHHRFFRD
jgi:hypothetical protein